MGLRPRDCGSHRSRPAQFERKHRVQQSRRYKAKGDLDHATADFSQAIRINPRSAIAYFNRGIAHGLRREFDRALADLNEAIRLSPKNAEYFEVRGMIFEAKGDTRGPIKGFIKEAQGAFPFQPSGPARMER